MIHSSILDQVAAEQMTRDMPADTQFGTITGGRGEVIAFLRTGQRTTWHDFTQQTRTAVRDHDNTPLVDALNNFRRGHLRHYAYWLGACGYTGPRTPPPILRTQQHTQP